MSWQKNWDDADLKQQPIATAEENEFLQAVKKRFTACVAWEAKARENFEYDIKFANGDTHNKYQWDNDLVLARELESRPCLTVNKVNQHNLMIINDAKQNKPGVRIRPVGDDASFEGAQIYQEIIYHIEYISSAEQVYDSATVWQVSGGIGYWRLNTDYLSDSTFDQEIYIRRIKDPRSVYLDPDINEVDGSDARFGFIFEEMPKDLFREKHPKWAAIASGGGNSLGNPNSWVRQDNIIIAEYYCKEENEDKLVTWTVPEGPQTIKKLSNLNEQENIFYKEIKKRKELWDIYDFKERTIITDDVLWYKIAGDRIIEKGKWLGKYIPIIRLVGTETVIDGVLDRKGHTRALINPQQIYNYNTSANVEYGALQNKVPYITPSAAIENFEEYYKTANRDNFSYLPYNHVDDDGNEIPAPKRQPAPQPSEAYVDGLKIAENEMMMASGQYQSQFGENENAKSGVAINARQRQGDRATYHFIDGQAIAIRFTGKQLIDLIPKVYDTPRIIKILAQDGSRINVNVDIEAKPGYKDVTDPAKPLMDNGQKVKEIIFNPDFGMYDIQADTGPSYATKRMETSSVLTQIAAQQKDFLAIGGDVLFKNLDFAGAEILADRYYKALPPNLKGEAPDPHIEEAMHKASDLIQTLQGQVAELTQQVKDKSAELTQKGQRLDLDFKRAVAQETREDYKAINDRLAKLGNSGPGISVEQIQTLVLQTLAEALKDGNALELSINAPGPHEGGTVATVPGNEPEQEMQQMEQESQNSEEPPMEGAQQAKDGNWYVKQGDGYAMVQQ